MLLLLLEFLPAESLGRSLQRTARTKPVSAAFHTCSTGIYTHEGQVGISVLLSSPQHILALYQLWVIAPYTELETATKSSLEKRWCQKPPSCKTAENPRRLKQHWGGQRYPASQENWPLQFPGRDGDWLFMPSPRRIPSIMRTWRLTAHCAWREFWECSWKGGVNWGELGEQHISSHLNVSQCFKRPIPTGPTRQKLEQIVLSGCTTHPNFFVKGTRWIWDNGMAFVTQHPKLLRMGPETSPREPFPYRQPSRTPCLRSASTEVQKGKETTCNLNYVLLPGCRTLTLCTRTHKTKLHFNWPFSETDRLIEPNYLSCH